MEVIKKIKEANFAMVVTVHVASWHLTSFKPLIKEWMPGLEVDFSVEGMKNAPDFKNTNYGLTKYRSWIDELKKVNCKANDVIISDNLIGVLNAFPNAILMGSFLWPEVILHDNPNGNYSEILGIELELLKKRKPVMIGLEAMAMPLVRSSTVFKGLPWFCERNQHNLCQNKGGILFTAGGTNSARNDFIKLINKNINKPFKIYVDKGIYDLKEDINVEVEKFDFNDESYSKLSLIVARPGIGVITDAVKYGVPIICYGELDQYELSYNSLKVEELGLGRNIMGKTAEVASEIIMDVFNDNNFLAETNSNLIKQPVNGAQLAAELLLNYN